MEGLRTNSEQSGTYIKPMAQVRYESGNICAGRHVMLDLMLELNDKQVKLEAILEHMNQGHTATKVQE